MASLSREGSDQESDDSDVDDILDLLESSSSESEDDRQPEKRADESERLETDSKVDRSLSDLVSEQVKSYRNTLGGDFVTGVDVTSKEAKAKREKRAKRFGIAKEDANEGVEDISTIVLPPGSKIDGSEVRPEALFIKGVDDMSTKDIFTYFKDFYPSSIEWINDTSCNVVWLDSQSAARALMGMSRPRKHAARGRKARNSGDTDPEPMEEDTRDSDIVNDRETGETERIAKSSPPPDTRENSQDSMSLPQTESEDSVQAMECLDMVEADMRPVDIKSEDAFRIGKSNPKADDLFIRFATKDDKKERDAYKHSQYYIKYGNPNLGGMKGLISKSRMQLIREGKFDPKRRKRIYEIDDDEDEDDSRSSFPNKRQYQGSRQLDERRNNPKDLRERLGGGARHSSSKASQSSGSEDQEDEDEDDDLDAQLKHALGDRSPPKRSRQMYADEIEEKLKQIRKETSLAKHINKPRDARENISGRAIKDRLGHIHGAPTPAQSLENLKVIVDNNDEDEDSAEENSENEKSENEKSKSENSENSSSEEEDYHTIRPKGSDLRAYLHNREVTKKLMDKYPSLQIEVGDDD